MPHGGKAEGAFASSTGSAPRRAPLFAAGVVLVVAAAAAAWMAWEYASPRGTYKENLSTAPAGLRSLGACALEPAVPPAGGADGKFPLQADVTGLIRADIATFRVVGSAAAAAGRPRDAEIAFLMSCRVAGALRSGDSVEFADAKYQLGDYYARLALEGSPSSEGSRNALLTRAELLYADSLQAYGAVYGDKHEKALLATKALTSVRQILAQVSTAPAESTPLPERASRAAESAPPSMPALPGARATPTEPSLPANADEMNTRQALPERKSCPDAVATLGLCNPD